MDEAKICPTWGYSKKDATIFDLKDGEGLPKGYYPHPAMVPGSEAELQHQIDAEKEGATVIWDKPEIKPNAD